MGDLGARCAECSAVFYQKTARPLSAPTPTHPILTSDFFLFAQMKELLKGKHFANVEKVKQKMAEALKSFKIDEFKNCFEQWEKYVHRCITSNGEYFEGNWSLNM